MNHRHLNTLNVSAIGLGCMGMSEFYGDSDEQQSIAVLEQALSSGITLFDTADIYGYGANEKLLGKVLRQHREQIVIASKFGIVRSVTDPLYRGVNAKPEYVKACCEASLQRLGIDTLDLYYLHRMDPSVPIEDTMGALADLVKAGKIRHVGLSEASAAIIRRAHAVHPLTAIQSEYSLMSRQVEHNGVLDTCRELGIGFVAYSPLSRGLISDHLALTDDTQREFRHHLPRFQGENLKQNQCWVQAVRDLARAQNCSTAQLALAWVLAQGDFIVPIPGTRHRKYLLDNIGATNITLSSQQLTQLNDWSASHPVAGERYASETAMGRD